MGGIYANASSAITVLDSYFADNQGGQGGGVAVWNSQLFVNGSTFIKNNGNGQGGNPAISGPCTGLSLISNRDRPVNEITATAEVRDLQAWPMRNSGLTFVVGSTFITATAKINPW